MRYFPVILMAMLWVSVAAKPADIPKFDTRDLSITWEAVQNDSPKKGQALNAVTITNNGKATFPATGWKMYFNSARMILEQTLTGNASIKFINGDLFSLTPAASFPDIKPGQSVRIEYVTEDEVVNITDGPEGFYVVWDVQPDRGYNTGAFNYKPFKPNYTGLITPATVYEQNKSIVDVPETQLTKVFPTPVSYKETGGFFILDKNSSTHFDGRFASEVRLFDTWLGQLLQKGPAKNTGASLISFNFKDGLGSEAYEITITTGKIDVNASTATGLFYAIQSLKTLVPVTALAHRQKEIPIPCVEIKDEPRFAYRAFMLDVGRNFQPKKEIFRVLDVMALYKINVFHMHLTEDEGWRLEMPSLPELTQVGGRRGHTLDSKQFLPASHGSGGELENKTGTGFYTKADFIEILKYANERHIMVVPEIEAPGHARAAIKSMNARYDRLMAEGRKAEAKKYLLYSPGDKSQYSTAQYWTDNVIDVSLPSTYNFVETVIGDIVNMYKEAGVPLKTINWGGDEVPAHVWEQSPAFLALKASNPEIQSTADVWYYFYGRVMQLLKVKGLYLSGWEEMALRKTALDGTPVYIPNPDFMPEHPQVEVWNNTLGGGNEDLAYKLANAGYKTVLTPVTNMYFDMAHYKSFDEPGYYWGAFSDIDKPFSFIPFDYFKNSKVDRDGLPINRNIFIGKQRLTDYGKSNIIGLQSAVWGENIKSTERLEYMMLPRLLGFAERAWAKDPDWATEKDPAKAEALYQTAWSNFLNVLGKRELPRLSYMNGGYNYRVPKPGVVLQDGKYLANVQFPGLIIRYTTDGKDPDAKSKLYNDAVTSDGKAVKFRAFDTKGRGGNVSETVIP
ncbi:family 20 glycosylhydrolase [Mucilaginibacter sp. L3T2-6]|uniref:family 20 glycosylhydrolase n=1 Tax=Mucilaginibacter sp. L3T2-6 TaxID=3062491 RepID=UPI0026770EE4|nr:family 20 glycosylhydrolase [Mucilaginibacter sp. L3T2-6]MDO3642420.1 family 20 glycosylhydrolase [Mucilaginibacter sp. L3T2-6]MDV6214915.1 family 20 glycosylhydrolase [Mucilaginibacter sp. L3T2-6]